MIGGKSLGRRSVLRGGGVAMSLPWLTAMQPAMGSTASASPQRFVAVTLGLGLVASNLVPEQAGKGYVASRYLTEMDDIRDRYTVFSGVSHPGVKGGHRAEASILTASPMGSSGRAKNTISLDQYLAKYRGDQTRFPSLVLSTGGSTSPCYTENGAMIPPLDRASKLFSLLFVDESPKVRTQQEQRVKEGRSIMDLVGAEAKSLQQQLGAGDRDRLDAFFTSVRDLEKRMAETEKWAQLPKPKVDLAAPVDITNPSDLIGRQKTMCQLMKLALQTDSTRYITLHLPGAGGVIPIQGVDQGYHNLSHHGMDEAKLEQLALVETALINEWADFLRSLRDHSDASGDLLGSTSVLLTSNLGNASNHDNRNMPVLFAGGPFQHGQHLAFDQRNNYPLPNLFVSVLQANGLEIDRFATSTGTMDGLHSRAI
ncbi:MAG: DUF1552 domain-containing protein [Rubripirellula sp.]